MYIHIYICIHTHTPMHIHILGLCIWLFLCMHTPTSKPVTGLRKRLGVFLLRVGVGDV